MKIKRKSWHYRWLRSWEGVPLAGYTPWEYFGKLALTLLGVAVVAISILLLTALAHVGLYMIGLSMFAAVTEWVASEQHTWINSAMPGLGRILWIAVGGFVAFIIVRLLAPKVAKALPKLRISRKRNYIDFE